MHDYDNNTKLDGLELLKSMTHFHDEHDDEHKENKDEPGMLFFYSCPVVEELNCGHLNLRTVFGITDFAFNTKVSCLMACDEQGISVTSYYRNIEYDDRKNHHQHCISIKVLKCHFLEKPSCKINHLAQRLRSQNFQKSHCQQGS